MTDPSPEWPAGRERSGHSAVDAVLDSLAGLDELPPDEQVRALEDAHEAFRGALADAGEGPA